MTDDSYMKEEIRTLLEDLLPILMSLSDKYNIKLETVDATPRNLKTLDSIVTMVQRKLQEKEV